MAAQAVHDREREIPAGLSGLSYIDARRLLEEVGPNPGLVGFVSDPTPVRRDLGIAFKEPRAEERLDFPFARQREHQDVTGVGSWKINREPSGVIDVPSSPMGVCVSGVGVLPPSACCIQRSEIPPLDTEKMSGDPSEHDPVRNC